MLDRDMYWIVFVCLCVTVCAKPDKNEPSGRCGDVRCSGVEYECIDNRCYCARGYIPNHFQARCVRCPGIGENCFSQCCNRRGNGTLSCWQGVCQPCYDENGTWICSRDNMKELLLISGAQVAMGAALVLGILATFVLLYKLCAATNISALGSRSPAGSRLSIGSLQLYVEERLRDAPPRYSRGAAGGSAAHPATTYLNNGFVPECSPPPPPYTEVVKTEERNTAIHI